MIGEDFGAFFVIKFVAQKKSFAQNSLCRRATLIFWGDFRSWAFPDGALFGNLTGGHSFLLVAISAQLGVSMFFPIFYYCRGVSLR